MAAELNHSVDVTDRLLPAQKHCKANSPTQSFTELALAHDRGPELGVSTAELFVDGPPGYRRRFGEVMRSFMEKANSASRKALRRMCETQARAPIRIYSVKLRAHSVKLCVGLACFVGPQQAGAGGQLPSGRADRFLMRSASMPRNGQAAAAADLEQYGAFV
jgi:hypothetical protein